MPRIVFALSRHGAYQQPAGVPSASLPYPLTAEGEQQVNRLIEDVLSFCRHNDCALDPQIDSSPLLRAWQTATIAARRLTEHYGFTTRVAEHAALAERSVGSLANLTTDAIAQVMAQDPRVPPLPRDWKTNRDYRLPVPGAESLAQAGERVVEHLRITLESLRAHAKHDRLRLLIGHGGAIRHAAVTLGLLEAGTVHMRSMHHCTPVFWEWSEAQGFRHIAGEWKVRSHGGQLD